ncbi:MAG: hypothetical protein CVU61_16385 [Deltaproteobacteria bacterium HGW-Deltaproteobacteria-19]|jgi:hypothetical protein|nr:MAG: hypothetical protein CVU61_16385 [Deltaproteobacteria bacterium HGW-Deltaproteobacteria-19]
MTYGNAGGHDAVPLSDVWHQAFLNRPYEGVSGCRIVLRANEVLDLLGIVPEITRNSVQETP